jgi:hypothetical protein
MLWNGNECGQAKLMRISGQLFLVQIATDQKELETVEYFNSLGSMIRNGVRCKSETESRIATAKSPFNRKKTVFIRKLNLNLRAKLVKCYIWSIALYGAETLTIRRVNQKYLKDLK